MALPSSLHMAVIMDGNGRWAVRRGLPRTVGHRRGAEAVRRTVAAARERGLGALTLYAFSSDNWKRPRREVACLMALFRRYLDSEAGELAAKGVRLRVIGRRDRLPAALACAIARCEEATRGAGAMELRIAVDYSSRHAIAESLAGREARLPDVDLLVRTGGERRLSDFLLWECAYAELFFTDRMWPDFTAADLDEALAAFAGRQRRFGGLPEAGAA